MFYMKTFARHYVSYGTTIPAEQTSILNSQKPVTDENITLHPINLILPPFQHNFSNMPSRPCQRFLAHVTHFTNSEILPPQKQLHEQLTEFNLPGSS